MSDAGSAARRREAYGTLLFAAALAFLGYGLRDLTYFDEPRYAAVAKEMADSGSWAIPRLYDEPYVEKPPLYFWLAGLAGRALGWNSWAFYLPNVLAHFLTVLLVFDLGRRTVSWRAGTLAALALAACPFAMRYARSAQLESLLVFFETAAAWGLLRARLEQRLLPGYLGALALGLGVLVKGHVALFALLAPLAHMVATRDARALRRPWLLLSGAAVVLAPFAMWFAWVMQAFGAERAVEIYLGRQIVDRTAGGMGHWAPIPVGAEYLGALAAMSPFIAFLPGAFPLAGRVQRAAGGAADPARIAAFTFLGWGLGLFAILALVPSKRELYLLPATPAFALAAGTYLAAVERGERPLFRGARELGLCFAALLLVGSLGFPVFLTVQGAFSLEAALLALLGLLSGGVAIFAFRRGDLAAPRALLLEVACVSLLFWPAFERLETERFGLRAFGAELQRRVPPGEEVVVFEFTKAQAVRFFGERPLAFAEDRTALLPFFDGRARRFVVVKGARDARKLERVGGLETMLLVVEPREGDEDAMRLYEVVRKD